MKRPCIFSISLVASLTLLQVISCAGNNAPVNNIDDIAGELASFGTAYLEAKEKEAMLRRLLERSPLLSSPSKPAIGEFESNEDYSERIATIQENYERQWREALREISSIKTSRNNSLDVLHKLVQQEHERYLDKSYKIAFKGPQLPLWQEYIDGGNIDLPTFDRKSMSFSPVTIEPGDDFDLLSSDSNAMVHISSAQPHYSFQIKTKSLDLAQEVHDGLLNGHITVKMNQELLLINIETNKKVITKDATIKTMRISTTAGEKAANVGKLAKNVTLGLLYYVVTGDQNPPLDHTYHSSRTKEEVIDAEEFFFTTRYSLVASPISLEFVRQNGSAVRGVEAIRSDIASVEQVEKFAQASVSGLLRRGDVITGVENYPVYDVVTLRKALSNYQQGEKILLYYRHNSTSGPNRSVLVNGGELLGVRIKPVEKTRNW